MAILDLSAHQKNFDFSKIHGVEDYIYRASIGTSARDGNLAYFMQQNSKPLGLYVASYSKNATEAAAEADYICGVARSYNIEPIIFYDWEYFSADYIKKNFGIDATPQLIRDMTTAFCERVKQWGFRTGVYFNYDFLNRYGRDFFETHKDYIRWYARPGHALDYECDLLQYEARNGTEFGYNANVDKNRVINAERLYSKPQPEIKPISNKPVRLIIGFATQGDFNKIKDCLHEKSIFDYKEENGFITTNIKISAGDQIGIIKLCNELVVPIDEYITIPEPQTENWLIKLIDLLFGWLFK